MAPELSGAAAPPTAPKHLRDRRSRRVGSDLRSSISDLAVQLAKDPSRSASRKHSFWQAARHNASSPDNNVVADRDSRKNDHASSQPNMRADDHRTGKDFVSSAVLVSYRFDDVVCVVDADALSQPGAFADRDPFSASKMSSAAKKHLGAEAHNTTRADREIGLRNDAALDFDTPRVDDDDVRARTDPYRPCAHQLRIPQPPPHPSRKPGHLIKSRQKSPASYGA